MKNSKEKALLTRLWVIWVKLTQGIRRRICGWNKTKHISVTITMMNFISDFFLYSNPTYFELVNSLFEGTPFLLIWLANVGVWFFLEIFNWSAHTFNVKHTYLNNLTRSNIFLILLKSCYQKLTLRSFIKVIYIGYL